MDNIYLRTKDAARYLGVSNKTILRYARDGRIPCTKPGGKLAYFLITDLDLWVAAKTYRKHHDKQN